MNIANKLTVFRVVLTPVFVVLMYAGEADVLYRYIACAVFIIAAATDLLDGYIARKRNLVSDFGKFADPLADKILTVAAFVMMVEQGTVMAWIVILILIREFTVTGMRVIAAGKGSVIAASSSGKVKTVLQMVTIIYAILFGQSIVTEILMYLVAAVTLWSGAEYMIKNKNIINLS